MTPSTAAPGSKAREKAESLRLAASAAVIFLIVLAIATCCHLPSASGEFPTTVHLSPSLLAWSALATFMRMFAATLIGIASAFGIALLGSKFFVWRMPLSSVLGVLRHTPILGFLPFLKFWGGEISTIALAAMSVAWTSGIVLMETFRAVPTELEEAARGLGLTSWQRLWRLEAPFTIPAIVSSLAQAMPLAWFSLIAAEMVSVAGSKPVLPGIGGYAATAALRGSVPHILQAILVTALLVVVYDRGFVRPWQVWSSRYRTEIVEQPDPWVLTVWRRTRGIRWVADHFRRSLAWLGGLPLGPRRSRPLPPSLSPGWRVIGWVCVCALLLLSIALFGRSANTLRTADLLIVAESGIFTALRVIVMVMISLAIWIPLGVWMGLRPRASRIGRSVARFCALFPENIGFAMAGWAAFSHDLSGEFWPLLLMLLAAQWVALAHVLRGMQDFPTDLLRAALNLRVSGLLWWRRVLLPGLAPALVAGSAAAAAAGWNVSILAEAVQWKSTSFRAPGLGAYIASAMHQGDLPHVALGVATLCLFLTLSNRFFWTPLKLQIERRLYTPEVSQ